MKFCVIGCRHCGVLVSVLYLNLYFMVLVINKVTTQYVESVVEVDCTDDENICEPNSRCIGADVDVVDQYDFTVQLWNNNKSIAPKSICKCKPNWHGSICNICSGRFSLTSESGSFVSGIGNYTPNNNCTWLLNSRPLVATPIRLNVTRFSTECGWDHLYVFDGSSRDAPLVAVLSGHVPKPASYYWSQLVLNSGSGYFYFTSDTEYNMPGFQIDYSYSRCPEMCNKNGVCNDDGTCQCNKGWIGSSCSQLSCPNNCSHPLGSCIDDSCLCSIGYRGYDCSINEQNGYWEEMIGLDMSSRILPKVTSHKSVVVNGHLYITGGYSFAPQNYLRTFSIDLTSKFLHAVEVITNSTPASRYNHAADSYDEDIYICGGVLNNGTVSSELWQLNLKSSEWQLITSKDGSSMIAVAGHSVHIVGRVLFVFFGHNPSLGYLSLVQRFDLVEKVWTVMETSGIRNTGIFGHASVYDRTHNQVLIHGSYSSRSNIAYFLNDALISFNLKTFSWKYLASSGYVKYLHSAVIIDRHVFVFGGNTHNDTTISRGAFCYTSKFLVYDIECDHWSALDEPTFLFTSARYGHSANVQDNKMYIYGGFNGITYNDLLRYSRGQCSGSSKTSCLETGKGVRCAWVNDSTCMDLSEAKRKVPFSSSSSGVDKFQGYHCPSSSEKDRCIMEERGSCESCVSNGCLWCGDACLPNGTLCFASEVGARNADMCKNTSRSSFHCSIYHTCHTCIEDDECHWIEMDLFYKCESVLVQGFVGNKTCRTLCSDYSSCENCTSNTCMWCLNRNQCIHPNFYVTTFPYGMCQDWTTDKIRCQANRCEVQTNCPSCLQNPSCGFCNDGSNTGRGRCMPGGVSSPSLGSSKCNSSLWSFAECPLCQCNGHSTCYPNTDKCISCQNFTEGRHCENCRKGYWKDPTLEYACSSCECGTKADTCDPETGECLCRLRGASGKNCQECDKYHRFIDDTCFYELTLNFMLTFNLSKSDRQHHREMNLLVSTTSERDVEVNLNCSSAANLTIFLRKDLTDVLIVENVLVESYTRRFSTLELKTADEKNSTIFLFIRDFQYPILIQISFSQADQLDLFKFFITFFSCFFSLLLIAFVAWKFKQRYDVFRRNQRHLKEMAEMASRPCGKCFLIVDQTTESASSLPMLNLTSYNNKNSLKMAVRQKRIKAVPVAVEPLSNQKAAVLSVIIRMPYADEQYTLPDQSGLAIASALVTISGHNRRSSSDPSTKVNLLKSFGDRNSNVPRLV